MEARLVLDATLHVAEEDRAPTDRRNAYAIALSAARAGKVSVSAAEARRESDVRMKNAASHTSLATGCNT